MRGVHRPVVELLQCFNAYITITQQFAHYIGVHVYDTSTNERNTLGIISTRVVDHDALPSTSILSGQNLSKVSLGYSKKKIVVEPARCSFTRLNVPVPGPHNSSFDARSQSLEIPWTKIVKYLVHVREKMERSFSGGPLTLGRSRTPPPSSTSISRSTLSSRARARDRRQR